MIGYPFLYAGFVLVTNLTGGALIGAVVGIYDVNSRRHREAITSERETVIQQAARIAVLNRVLRHNIRNDANVIHGTAMNIANQRTGDLSHQAELAAETTEQIVSLSEKARRIEHTLGIRPESYTAIDVPDLVEHVLEPYRRSDDDHRGRTWRHADDHLERTRLARRAR